MGEYIQCYTTRLLVKYHWVTAKIPRLTGEYPLIFGMCPGGNQPGLAFTVILSRRRRAYKPQYAVGSSVSQSMHRLSHAPPVVPMIQDFRLSRWPWLCSCPLLCECRSHSRSCRHRCGTELISLGLGQTRKHGPCQNDLCDIQAIATHDPQPLVLISFVGCIPIGRNCRACLSDNDWQQRYGKALVRAALVRDLSRHRIMSAVMFQGSERTTDIDSCVVVYNGRIKPVRVPNQVQTGSATVTVAQRASIFGSGGD